MCNESELTPPKVSHTCRHKENEYSVTIEVQGRQVQMQTYNLFKTYKCNLSIFDVSPFDMFALAEDLRLTAVRLQEEEDKLKNPDANVTTG